MGTNVNTPFFLGTHTRIQARCQCPSIRSRPCTQAQKWALGPCVHTIFVSSLQSIPLFSLLSSYFKVASDRVKWSNYVHSHISATQSVNTTPFWAVTQALVLKHQVWTVPYQTIHMLNPLTDCRYNDDEEEEDENNTWFSVISQYGVHCTCNFEHDKELKQARLINKKACLRGLKKTWILACPLGKQLSCQGSLLTRLSGWPLPIGQESFESHLPSKKIDLFQATQWDCFEPCYTIVDSLHPWTVNC